MFESFQGLGFIIIGVLCKPPHKSLTAEHYKNSSCGSCTETKVSKVCSLLSAESWRAARFASQDLPVMHFCVVSLATLMFLEKASREFSLWLSLEWDWSAVSYILLLFLDGGHNCPTFFKGDVAVASDSISYCDQLDLWIWCSGAVG